LTDTTAPATSSRSVLSTPALLAIGVVLGGLVIFAGNWDVKKGENGGTGPAIVSAVILVGLTAVLYFVVLPRVKNVDRSVIILSAIAIVTIVAFWLGVTPILAAAAVAAGAKATSLSRAALVLQGIAVVAAVLTVIVTLAQSHLF
jgi:hypothetical protein